jgi:hypothetical protein
LAAGLVTSQAQVYSQNVVGYINITLKPGWNLIANQLVNGTNGLNQIFPTAPADTALLKWNFGGQTFGAQQDYFDGLGWYQGVNPSTATVSPGEGFFMQNQTGVNQVVTLTGQVTTGNNLTVNIQGPGYGFYSSIVPDGQNFDNNGFPTGTPAADMTYFTFDPTLGAAGSYTTTLTYYDGLGWYNGITPSTPAPSIGQGFVINNPNASTSWTRNFNP